MTSASDLDRQLAEWFESRATSTVPDGLLARSVSAIGTTRQRPGWIVRDRDARRPSRAGAATPRRVQRFGAAFAALVLVAAAGITLTRLPGAGKGAPTATPPASSVASPSIVPDALRATWVGPTRIVPQISPPIIQSAFTLTGLTFRYLGGGDPILASTVGLASNDTIVVRTAADGAGCRSGDEGTYRYALTSSGRTLSLERLTDACAARAAAIVGSWSRVDCPSNPNSFCLGALDPGEHASAAFNPFLPRSAWQYDYGRLSYAVPEGWVNKVDGPDGYILARAGDQTSGVNLFSTALADSQAPGCPGTPATGVGSRARDLATWLTRLPGLAATEPVAVTVGGLSGFTLDLAVKPTWTRTCPYSNGKPYVALFTNGDRENNFDWGLAAGGRMRLYLLDLPDGRTMLIDVEAQDATTWDALVADAAPVIASFRFNP